MKKRTEKDSLGTMEVPLDALYGIHSMRAATNFPAPGRFHPEWYKAMGLVKQACYMTYAKFRKAVLEKTAQPPISLIDSEKLTALTSAASEIASGKYYDSFIVPPVQGGAGTSINMNINEIIANCALIKLGKKPGGYDFIDPIEDANIFQSTNDTVPTALKLAIMKMLGNLSEKINSLRAVVEQLESVHRNSLRIGYTQMQAAVPSSFGMLFGAYNEALSRDWWRVSKCFERIKTVNLGGSATGTALGVPRFFVMEAVPTLQALTSLPITRSENLPDATSNLDAFVEVHATIKAHAVNLEKIVSDIRLLASDIASSGEMSIPARQVGSSIMPGKVNPVIPEYVISCAHTVYSNDMLISGLCAQGCLELNAYLPSIGNAILNSLELLTACNDTIRLHLFTGLTVNENTALERLIKSPVIATALTPVIGYHKAGQLAARMKEKGETIFEANNHLKIISEEKLRGMLKPQELLKTGFSLSDLEKSE